MVLLVGLLGGFTTYSSFAFQSAEMLGARRVRVSDLAAIADRGGRGSRRTTATEPRSAPRHDRIFDVAGRTD